MGVVEGKESEVEDCSLLRECDGDLSMLCRISCALEVQGGGFYDGVIRLLLYAVALCLM